MRGVKSEVVLDLGFHHLERPTSFKILLNLDSFLAIAEELHMKGFMGTKNYEMEPIAMKAK